MPDYAKFRKGFTLVELLVSIVLLAMLTTALFGGVTLGTRVWATGERATAELARIRAAQIQLSDLLSRAYPLVIRSEGGDPHVDFEGASASIDFLTAAPSDIAPGGLARITVQLDQDADGVTACRDNCPLVPNPDQTDLDLDGVGDVCDNCPSVYNPDQADTNGNGIGTACDDSDFGSTITISFKSALGKGSGLLSWRTAVESDLVGFNVLVMTSNGNLIQLNTALIPCAECTTGLGHAYSFVVPKHKNGHNIFVQIVYAARPAQIFGPAIRQ